MADPEAPPAPSSAPALRGRSTDHLADQGSTVRPLWRRRAWRWVANGRTAAAVGLFSVLGAFAWAMQDARFVVHTVSVGGNRLVDTASLAQLAAVEGTPIWAVDPAQVAARLRTHPYITGAAVTLHLPDRVEIAVREPRHAITWQAGSQRYSIAPDGQLTPLAASVPVSATAIIHDWRAAPIDTEARIPPAVVALAQVLLVRLPAETGLALDSLAWDPVHGLVVVTADGRALFWGDSAAFERQLQVVIALERQKIAYRVLDLRGRIAAYRTEEDRSLPLSSSTTKLRES